MRGGVPAAKKIRMCDVRGRWIWPTAFPSTISDMQEKTLPAGDFQNSCVSLLGAILSEGDDNRVGRRVLGGQPAAVVLWDTVDLGLVVREPQGRNERRIPP